MKRNIEFLPFSIMQMIKIAALMSEAVHIMDYDDSQANLYVKKISI